MNRRRLLLAGLALPLSACTLLETRPTPVAPAAPVTPPTPRPPPKIALALGGGAARGFAHIGVIKALEAQGVVPDFVVGTSAGAVVGVLYAAGYSGFDLQRLAIEMDESQITDWNFPDRGVIKGRALQDFINKAVGGRTLEKLKRKVAVVATDLGSGDPILFQVGDAGMAVRASSSVPGLFQPVTINGRDYVDGGLVSPVPVRAARSLGADFVIAVDISAKPRDGKTQGTLDIMLQTFAIMGKTLNSRELPEADVVIRPRTEDTRATDFKDRHVAVLEGEKAAAAALAELKAKLAKIREMPPK